MFCFINFGEKRKNYEKNSRGILEGVMLMLGKIINFPKEKHLNKKKKKLIFKILIILLSCFASHMQRF